LRHVAAASSARRARDQIWNLAIVVKASSRLDCSLANPSIDCSPSIQVFLYVDLGIKRSRKAAASELSGQLSKKAPELTSAEGYGGLLEKSNCQVSSCELNNNKQQSNNGSLIFDEVRGLAFLA